MNVQRFLAPTSREAMNKVKASLGDAAVILSTRTTEDGFEVLAMTEDGLRALPGMTDSTPPPARTVAAQPAAPLLAPLLSLPFLLLPAAAPCFTVLQPPAPLPIASCIDAHTQQAARCCKAERLVRHCVQNSG